MILTPVRCAIKLCFVLIGEMWSTYAVLRRGRPNVHHFEPTLHKIQRYCCIEYHNRVYREHKPFFLVRLECQNRKPHVERSKPEREQRIWRALAPVTFARSVIFLRITIAHGAPDNWKAESTPINTVCHRQSRPRNQSE